METRTDILNTIANYRGYTSYLEIGVGNGKNFKAIQCPLKVSVDPWKVIGTTYCMTSDEFFEMNRSTFDLIFIDGLHHSDQVNRDIDNSLECLSLNGTIVLHDCNPTNEYVQRVPCPKGSQWFGDVWKSVVNLRMTRSDLSVCVIDADCGCGVVRRGSQDLLERHDLTYDFLNQNRQSLLNLVSPSIWFNDFIRSL